MTQAATHPPLELDAPPGEPHLTIRRFVRAPLQLVWEAFTEPEHLKHWWGPHDMELAVCEIDMRVGGGYRFVHRAPDGTEYGFTGEFLELEPPRRIVQTFVYEGAPEHSMVETMTLEAVEGGTQITGRSVAGSVEGRDMFLETGMEDGVRETYERLDLLLTRLQG
jgi:uncharacterized protein YndB with AHSA1/START domain